MNKQLEELVNQYRQGNTNRRDFLRKLTAYAGGAAAASALLPFIETTPLMAAEPAQTKAIPLMGNDDGVFTETIEYKGLTGDIKAYLARPEKDKKYPAVIVIHEIFGLNAHIQDVTRRFAKEGFLALAPDALSSSGGSPSDPGQAAAKIRELDSEKTTGDFTAAVKYLETHPNSNGKTGCTGFCWGGAMTNQVAVHAPSLDAAVPYYGRQPSAEDVAKIKAPVLAHYAGDDARINEGIPAFEEALKKEGKEYKIYIYEGAKHAFNNDTNPERYNEEAAGVAWDRTIAFFKEKLT